AGVAQLLERPAAAHIGRLPKRPTPARLDRLRRIVDRTFAAPGGDDVGARVGQPERQRAPDPGGAADDDGHTARQIEGRPHREARRGSGFGVRRSGFPVPGSRFLVSGSWFWVLRSRFSFGVSRFSVLGSGFWVLGS